MPSVLICQAMLRRRPGRFRDVLVEAGFECIDPAPGLALTHEQLRELIPGADALVLGLERLTPDLFAIAPRLRVAARTGVGYDGVDLEAARTHGVVVTTTPGANHDSVAEHVFALLLALTREVIPNNAAIHAGGWVRRPGVPIRGKTLGLYGLGRIARAVAVRAKAFGMRILAHDLLPPAAGDSQLEIERVSPDELLAASDVVSLHVPLTEATQDLVDVGFLARMKPGAFLINTARGGMVVDADLRAALESGRLAGAGIDVFHQEPPPLDCPLRGAPNLILSPHVGGTDSGAVQDMAEAAAQCIVDLYRGRWPSACVVDESLREGWAW
ncbi:phosphoglycerate dehydrogenase [Paludisphaera rhizosphaerae]|uniref:phosphoglycerate dehydrogenase n=1 Tax=Paludisphaera rhizosphaerae TaxID=2711216 RepID=UPI0013EA6455|nr:phosphoglycerate dehydrogenase [Paludisphaera rhizosphaerae]